jgi:hypothetical protein
MRTSWKRAVGMLLLASLVAPGLPAGATTVVLPQPGTTHLLGVESGARAGTTLASAGDFDGDGVDDLVTGGRNVAYVVLGGPDGELRTDDQRVVRLSLAHPERRQDLAVASAGDVDADGLDDVLVGAPLLDGKTGAAFLVFGRAEPDELVLGDPATERVVTIAGAEDGDRAGTSVAPAGDFDGDGAGDVLVGARGAGARDRGAAYVVSGAALGDGVSLADTGYRIHDPAFGRDVGYSVSTAGDVNGDGIADVIVGAPSDLVTAPPAAYVVFGRRDATTGVSLRALDGAGWTIHGGTRENNEGAGEAVAGGRDVNGDGVADVVVGAPSATGPYGMNGVAFVIFGKADARTVRLGNLGDDGFRIEAGTHGGAAGAAVALAPDRDGNGHADVLVGDPQERHGYRDATIGAAYHLVGQPGTDAVVLGRLGRDGVRYVAAGAARLGASVSDAGSFAGPGGIAAGAPGEEAAAPNAGGAYAFTPADPPAHDRPPRALVVSYGTRQITRFGNYCWDGLCVDRRPSFPRAAQMGAGDVVHFRIQHHDRPDGAALTAYRELDELGRPAGPGRSVDARLRPVREFQGAPVGAWELKFRLPRRPGHLYLGASAAWEGLDRGDVSWFAHLRVRRTEEHTDLASPPETTLRTRGVRDPGSLFSYCWSRWFSDGTGVTMCADYIRLDPLPPEKAFAGERAFVRIHTRHRPDRAVLHLYRETSYGYPSGRSRRVDYRMRRHLVRGKTRAWDLRFRLPERRGHVYPLLRASWDQHGTAPYDWHLILR